MAKVTVRHNKLSRYSSLGMMALGFIVLLFVSGFVGIILIVIGFIMFRIYARQSKRSDGGSGPQVKGATP